VSQLVHKQAILKRARRIVVKVGSSLLSADRGLDKRRIRALVRDRASIGLIALAGGLDSCSAGVGRRRGGGVGARLRRLAGRSAEASRGGVGQIDLMSAYKIVRSSRSAHRADSPDVRI
jgi:glutamate 5-kinase